MWSRRQGNWVGWLAGAFWGKHIWTIWSLFWNGSSWAKVESFLRTGKPTQLKCSDSERVERSWTQQKLHAGLWQTPWSRWEVPIFKGWVLSLFYFIFVLIHLINMGSGAGGHLKRTSLVTCLEVQLWFNQTPREFRGNANPHSHLGSISAPSQTVWPSGKSTGLGDKAPSSSLQLWYLGLSLPHMKNLPILPVAGWLGLRSQAVWSGIPGEWLTREVIPKLHQRWEEQHRN